MLDLIPSCLADISDPSVPRVHFSVISHFSVLFKDNNNHNNFCQKGSWSISALVGSFSAFGAKQAWQIVWGFQATVNWQPKEMVVLRLPTRDFLFQSVNGTPYRRCVLLCSRRPPNAGCSKPCQPCQPCQPYGAMTSEDMFFFLNLFLILFESGIFMEFWMCFEWRGLRTGCERRCGRPERIRRLQRLCTTAGWLCSVSCSEHSRNSKRYNRCRKTVCTKKRSGLGDSYSGYGAPYMPAAREQRKTIWLASESFRNSVETETPAD